MFIAGLVTCVAGPLLALFDHIPEGKPTPEDDKIEDLHVFWSTQFTNA